VNFCRWCQPCVCSTTATNPLYSAFHGSIHNFMIPTELVAEKCDKFNLGFFYCGSNNVLKMS
jgi:hypothetical protein